MCGCKQETCLGNCPCGCRHTGEPIIAIERDLPESFWDVDVWPISGDGSFTHGSVDPAQRRRIIRRIVQLAGQSRTTVAATPKESQQ